VTRTLQTPTGHPGGPPPEPPLRRALSILGALGSLIGAVAAIAQLLDYAATPAATLWFSVGVVLAVGPALVTAALLIIARRWRSLGYVSLLLVLVVGGVGVIAWQVGDLIAPACPDEDRDDRSARYAYPRVLEDADDVNLEYCRVDINEGRPLTRRYTLRGKLVGSVPRDQVVILVAQPDPGTCDEKNQPGTGKYYLRQEIRFDGRVAAWDRSDIYGYPEAVSLRFTFYYVLTDEPVAERMRALRDTDPRTVAQAGLLLDTG
jgi:hypothetical protein